eukprot:Nk52_evm23s32 gene=Nk52_evmTU23s32
MGGGTRREDPAGYDPMRGDPVCNPMHLCGYSWFNREEGRVKIITKDSPLNHKLSTLNQSNVGDIVSLLIYYETGGRCCSGSGSPPYVPRKMLNSSNEELPISVNLKIIFDKNVMVERDKHFNDYIVVTHNLLNLYQVHFDQIQLNVANTTAPDDIYAVVESASLEFTSVRGLGRFLQNNFAQVKRLALAFYEVYEEFEFERDMVAELVELESLTVKVVTRSSTLSDNRGLKKIPNFVFSSEDGVVKKKAKLTELSIDIPYADISEWHIDDYMINLATVELNVGIAPIPQSKEGYINSPWKHMPLVTYSLKTTGCTEHSDMGIRQANSVSPKRLNGTSIYFQAICDGIKKYRASPFSWDDLINFYVDSGNCNVPALIDSDCALLLESFSSLKNLAVIGFTMNEAFVNAIGRAKKLRVVNLLSVEWAYFEDSLYIPMGYEVGISMRQSPTQANLELIAKKGPIALDLARLCVYPCDLNIDGGGYSTDSFSLVNLTASSALFHSRKILLGEPMHSMKLSRVNIEDSAWQLLQSRIFYQLSAFSVRHVDVKDAVRIFGCFANTPNHEPCVVLANSYGNLESLEVVGKNRSVECGTPESRIDLQLLSAMPRLNDLRLENVCVIGFANSSFSGILHLVNIGLKEDFPKSFILSSSEVVVSSNGIRNGTQYLRRFFGGLFNMSRNNISEFNVQSAVVGSDLNIENYAFYKWLGVQDLDLSYNELENFKMELYKVMLLYYCVKAVSTINLSNNKLSLIQLHHDIPPRDAQGPRNFSREYKHCGYNAISRRIVSNVTLSVDISQNEFTALGTTSFNSLRTLQFLNVSHNRIRKIETHFLNGTTCLNENGCYVDLSHNQLGLDQNLSLIDFSQQSCVSHLDLSYNGFETVPGGLGSLIQKCLLVYRDYREPFDLENSERENNPLAKRSYINVDLKYNNISTFDRSFCDGLNESYVDMFFEKERRTNMFIYVDLSHNKLMHISEKAFDCNYAFLLLNINHNPIVTLPNLIPHRNYPLILLSAANTSITGIPETFNNPDTLFSLKSIYISGKMNWTCCELLQISPMINSTSQLLRLNPDEFEDVDLVTLMELNSYAPSSSEVSVSSLSCRYKSDDDMLTFEEFKNSKWRLDRNVCACSDVHSLTVLASVASPLLMVYFAVIAIVVVGIMSGRSWELGKDDFFTWTGLRYREEIASDAMGASEHPAVFQRAFFVSLKAKYYTSNAHDPMAMRYSSSEYEGYMKDLASSDEVYYLMAVEAPIPIYDK